MTCPYLTCPYLTCPYLTCVPWQDRLGVRPHMIQIKLPQENIIKYGLRLGDEMILASLSLFKPEVFGLQGQQLTRTQLRGESDPEDPYDQDYLRRTSRQSQGVQWVFVCVFSPSRLPSRSALLKW